MINTTLSTHLGTLIIRVLSSTVSSFDSFLMASGACTWCAALGTDTSDADVTVAGLADFTVAGLADITVAAVADVTVTGLADFGRGG